MQLIIRVYIKQKGAEFSTFFNFSWTIYKSLLRSKPKLPNANMMVHPMDTAKFLNEGRLYASTVLPKASPALCMVSNLEIGSGVKK